MKNLVIIGAGDFARETVWIAERMNLQYPQWNILGYVDDGKAPGMRIDGYPVLGSLDWLSGQAAPLYGVCAVGTASLRRQMWTAAESRSDILPATLVDSAAVVGKNCEIGGGSIVCAGVILAIGVKLGNHCIVNLGCVLGHDAALGDFCTLHPRVDLSGNVRVGSCSDIGAGALVRDEIEIGESSIVGMGSLVTKDIPAGMVAYGSPCRVVRKNEDGRVFR